MKRLLAVLALVSAGCVSAPKVPPPRYYVLGDAGAAASAHRASQESRPPLIDPTAVSAFYDTQRLVYSRAPGERAYYQFAAWTERPGRAFAELLGRRLGAPLTTSGVRGDLVLHTRLEELYHDTARTPGHVTLVVSAGLVDAAGRQVGVPGRFVRNVPTQSANAAGVAEAANRAVGGVLDDIAAWVERSAGEPGTTASAGTGR